MNAALHLDFGRERLPCLEMRSRLPAEIRRPVWLVADLDRIASLG